MSTQQLIGYRIGSDISKSECPTESILKETKVEYIPCSQGSSKNQLSFCNEHTPSMPSHYFFDSGEPVVNRVFNTMYHPGMVSQEEIFMTSDPNWENLTSCSGIYLMRAAYHNDASKPTTCIAVARVPEIYVSRQMNIYRFGYTPYPQKLTNQYQDDFIKPHGYRQEKLLLPPLLRDLTSIKRQVISLLGDARNQDGTRRTAIVMVANEGVMDIVLNTICSARAAKIDLSNQILFLGQPEYQRVVENFGLKAIYHPAFGNIPSNAAGFYADVTFGYLMWMKVIAAYITSSAGFDVLFQDADVVWIHDPVPHMKTLSQDMLFMDDGARSPRFAPFGFNSGFYFMKYNPKTVYLQERMIQLIGEITYTHSHQTTLTRYASEVMYLFGLNIGVLPQEEFPSGYMYHKSKKFIQAIVDHQVHPFVFHMCWTGTRAEKLKYLKELGMWYLPDEHDAINNANDICEKGPVMRLFISQNPDRSIPDKCCVIGDYWKTSQ